MTKIIRSAIPYEGPSTENLIEFVKNGLRKNSDQILIIDSGTGQTWTGKEIETAISKIALYLIEECGIKKGDYLSLYHESTDEICILMLAIISVGGVYNLLSEQFSGYELHNACSVLGCKFLFSRKALLKKVQKDLVDIEGDLKVISLDEVCEGYKNGCKTIKSLFAKYDSPGILLEKLVDQIKINPEVDYAAVQFSSGTTGKPKPIPRTHKNLCHLVASVDHEELMNLKPGVVLTGALTLTHRPGLWALLASIHCGSTLVLWDNLTNVEEALMIIEKFKVNIFSSSLPLLSMLGNTGIKLKEKYDTSSWQHIITSGAKITNADLPKLLIKEFNLKSLRQCLGMTESGWVCFIEQSLAKDNYLSVGHVCPGTEMIVMDRESNQLLGASESGELALRGPQIFPGYLTQQPGVLNRSDFTEDNWFRMGDKGHFDKDELVYIEGRFKELLIFENEERFFPSEIEEIIGEHAAVEAVCVVRSDQVSRSDRYFDVARAFVTLKYKSSGIEQVILDFVAQKSPRVLLGGGIKVLDKFPRLPNGKVDRQVLTKVN